MAIEALLKNIDQKDPDLTYLGLAFWMAWNSIAFSGLFWADATGQADAIDRLVFTHLTACVVALIFIALASKQCKRFIAKNWFTMAGAGIATIGTVLILFTPSIAPAAFEIGGILTGLGTTLIFFRAAPLYGSLPPRRAVYMFARCMLYAAGIVFLLNCCTNVIAMSSFAILPLCASALLCIRSESVRGEAQMLYRDGSPTQRTVLVLAAIVICSTGFKVLESYILASMPTDRLAASILTSNVLQVVPALGIMMATLFGHDERSGIMKTYLVASIALMALMLGIALSGVQGPPTAALSHTICTLYNAIVWAMLAWTVYQLQSGALRVFGFGNAALATGTALGSLIAIGFRNGIIPESFNLAILVIFGILTLASSLFVFSENRMGNLLLPIKEDLLKTDVFNPQERLAAEWERNCQALAESHGLSARETDIFTQLAHGATPAEIAEAETISIYTVRAHVRAIYSKLNVHSKKELIALVNQGFDTGSDS